MHVFEKRVSSLEVRTSAYENYLHQVVQHSDEIGLKANQNYETHLEATHKSNNQ